MMRSLFSGVAGLKTHQTKMDVIGNNIANVNTVGYKNSSVTFQDLVYQTKSNASGPNANTGRAGVNAKQIGLGVNLGTIYSNVTSAGSAETTGNPFDVRINGESFFVVSNGSEQFYTRSGAFTVDADGTLCMSSNGYTVMGYGTVYNEEKEIDEISTASLTALKIMSPKNKTSEPKATTAGYFTGILDKNSKALEQESGQVVDMKVYDAEGYKYTVKYKITKNAAATSSTQTAFNLTITDILDSTGETIFREPNTAEKADAKLYAQNKELFFRNALYHDETKDKGVQTLIFDNTTGKLTSPHRLDMSVDENKNKTDAETLGFNLKLDTLLAASSDVKNGGNAAFTKSVYVDCSSLLNIDNKGTSTINGGNGGVDTTEGSGWAVGTLSAVSISVDGTITGSYTNGQTKTLGQIASAIFSNASGLEKAGDNLYVETMNSGAPVIGDVTANGGSYASGELEMSNVDLSAEFTSMITTQRGFQANSRIITVSDTMLEELINLKR